MDSVITFCLAHSLPEEIWGLMFYFLHKVFCSWYERMKKKGDLVAAQSWRTRSWIVYLVGLPAVVAMFVGQQNWIFASLEAGGLPMMFLGLVLTVQGKNKNDIDKALGKLDWIVYPFIAFGLGYSYYSFHGLVTLNQWLEIGGAGGFLVGIYLQAKDNEWQYGAYFFMNVVTAVLLWRDVLIWFMLQQIGSLAFVIDAWLVRRSFRPALAS